jgi:hypothetical protein
MKRRTLFAVALSGILLRASEVLGIEETKTETPLPQAIDRFEGRIREGAMGRWKTEFRGLSEKGEVLFEGDEAEQLLEEASSGSTLWCRVSTDAAPDDWNKVSWGVFSNP